VNIVSTLFKMNSAKQSSFSIEATSAQYCGANQWKTLYELQQGDEFLCRQPSLTNLVAQEAWPKLIVERNRKGENRAGLGQHNVTAALTSHYPTNFLKSADSFLTRNRW